MAIGPHQTSQLSENQVKSQYCFYHFSFFFYVSRTYWYIPHPFHSHNEPKTLKITELIKDENQTTSRKRMLICKINKSCMNQSSKEQPNMNVLEKHQLKTRMMLIYVPYLLSNAKVQTVSLHKSSAKSLNSSSEWSSSERKRLSATARRDQILTVKPKAHVMLLIKKRCQTRDEKNTC